MGCVARRIKIGGLGGHASRANKILAFKKIPLRLKFHKNQDDTHE